MYWQNKDDQREFRVPDDIQDVAFRIRCPSLPLEHAHALSSALHEALPWLAGEERAGIHLIHGAESGNGWVRPEDPETELLHLPRRARMTLRLPKERIGDAQALIGKVLDIGGFPLEVGEATVKPLSPVSTVFARYVVDRNEAGEEAFVEAVAGEVRDMGIAVRKLMCGRVHRLRTPRGEILTRSVMLADLDKEEAIRLQQRGVGPERKLGCGLFLPHKGIAPVFGDENT